MTKITLAALIATLLGLASNAEGKSRSDMSLEELRQASPPKAQLEACPMDDDNFWAHWATERGYEHVVRGDLVNAAECYDKAAAMSGFKRYGRIAAIL